MKCGYTLATIHEWQKKYEPTRNNGTGKDEKYVFCQNA